ncbi:unnamed protein product [Orchesella dallaii]|uniref:DOMON domain-containing protein n=1 Tax=Orchesella dallaii TaxID=48710 RepID=A0ABP1PHL7_9HEXA
MGNLRISWVILILISILQCVVSIFPSPSQNSVNHPEAYRHKLILEPPKKYVLEWEVDWVHKRVIFNVTVETKGYIGFGLSKRGKMSGADIVIAGVDRDGHPYISDRHAMGHQLPVQDEHQDWTLHAAWERGDLTFLSFSRAFETCDVAHDLPITDDLLRIIWAYGEQDSGIQYHFQKRGSKPAYLLDPEVRPELVKRRSKINAYSHPLVRQPNDVYSIEREFKMPPKGTTYWCTFHKAPTKSKRHIIGFNPIFPTELDRRHVHHFLLFRCLPPKGVDPVKFFDDYTRDGGRECYFQVEPDYIGSQYCKEVMYIFAVGGKPLIFPEHVGVPMSEDGPEYFLMQVHYDNPQGLAGLKIRSIVEVQYTPDLRPHDAGIWWVGTPPPAATNIFLPPNSLEHVIVGHCSSGCTGHIFPPEGISVFAALTHTHTTGNGMRVLHFRGNKELPWIMYDNNYDFNYQQWRMLREERRILPGDQLSVRCTYDTTPRNGSVVSGGYSTQQEMCDTPLFYYNRIPGYSNCRSQLRAEAYFDFLGVRNFTWNDALKQLEISSPKEFAGLTMVEYGNKFMNWDMQRRQQLQRHHLIQPHITMCPSNIPDIEYDPDLDEYPAALPQGIRRYKQVSDNHCALNSPRHHHHHPIPHRMGTGHGHSHDPWGNGFLNDLMMGFHHH